MPTTTSHHQPITSDALFLDAAIEVGNLLIKQAITDGQQTYWKVVNPIQKTVTYDRDDLYSGGSGIGLFFLELYKQTGRKKYLQIARKAIRSAAFREKSKGKQVHPSFMCGRLGVAYALIKLYQATDIRADRTQALALVKSCRGSYSTDHEYLNGNAGILLSLLHIHTVCNEPWLLEMANDYTQRVLQGIRQETTGIYWDCSPFQIRPLCGFSHGVAGIGFVLLELGRYLNNPAFYQIAEQAFAYENAFFVTSQKNWPDFRLHMWKPEQIAQMEAAYTNDDLRVFSEPGDMAAWCHGAPGIAQSRLSAYQLTGNQVYLQDIDHALQTTQQRQMHDISLCHGLAGNLDTCVESYVTLGRAKDRQQAYTFGKQLLQRWKEIAAASKKDKTTDELVEPEQPLDPSLFLGLAGVGYTFLRLHDPHLTPSILAPRLTVSLSEKLDAKLSTLQINEASVEAILSKDALTTTDDLTQLKRKLVDQHPSRGLLYIKQRLGQKSAHRLLELTDDELLENTLQLNTDCSIYVPTRRPSSAEAPQTQEIVLFNYTPLELEQRVISQFCYVVLETFNAPQKVQDTIDTISKRYGFEHAQPEQRQLLRSKVLEQIRQALYSQILVAGS